VARSAAAAAVAAAALAGGELPDAVSDRAGRGGEPARVWGGGRGAHPPGGGGRARGGVPRLSPARAPRGAAAAPRPSGGVRRGAAGRVPPALRRRRGVATSEPRLDLRGAGDQRAARRATGVADGGPEFGVARVGGGARRVVSAAGAGSAGAVHGPQCRADPRPPRRGVVRAGRRRRAEAVRTGRAALAGRRRAAE